MARDVLIPAHIAHETSAKWHASRARGQAARFATVENCRVGKLLRACGACGEPMHDVELRCCVGRICCSCDAHATLKRRARFFEAYKEAYRLAFRAGRIGWRAKYRAGGAWSDRHLTLTAPHIVVRDDSGAVDVWRTVTARLDLLWAALSRFWKRFRKLNKPLFADGLEFYRCFEWTPGSDGLGHPHFHVWLLAPWLAQWSRHSSPWLPPSQWPVCERERSGAPCMHCTLTGAPKALGLRRLWADALEKSGLSALAGRRYAPRQVILDIRSVRVNAAEIIREIAKPDGVRYHRRELRLRIEDSGARLAAYFEPWTISADPSVSDEVRAAVYCALEGKRLSQASAGFLGRADARQLERRALNPCRCEACKTCDPIVRKTVQTWDSPPSPYNRGDPEHPPTTGPALVTEQPAAEVDPHAFSERLRDGLAWARVFGLEYRADWRTRGERNWGKN